VAGWRDLIIIISISSAARGETPSPHATYTIVRFQPCDMQLEMRFQWYLQKPSQRSARSAWYCATAIVRHLGMEVQSRLSTTTVVSIIM